MSEAVLWIGPRAYRVAWVVYGLDAVRLRTAPLTPRTPVARQEVEALAGHPVVGHLQLLHGAYENADSHLLPLEFPALEIAVRYLHGSRVPAYVLQGAGRRLDGEVEIRE